MSDDSTKIGKTKLTYSCQKGDECSAPKEQNMLVVHGIEDDVVSYTSSFELIRKLQLAGFDHTQMLYPGVGHDIPKSHIYKHFYQTVTNYLAECFHIDDLSLAESESKK